MAEVSSIQKTLHYIPNIFIWDLSHRVLYFYFCFCGLQVEPLFCQHYLGVSRCSKVALLSFTHCSVWMGAFELRYHIFCYCYLWGFGQCEEDSYVTRHSVNYDDMIRIY